MTNHKKRATMSKSVVPEVICRPICGGALSLLGLLAMSAAALAADPAHDPGGVRQQMDALQGNWPGADFSVDVKGLTDNAATTGDTLQVEYLAGTAGYVTYLRVSSDGQIVGMRPSQSSATLHGRLSLPIQEHALLGDERAVFLFSQNPLQALLVGTDTETALGSDKAHAARLVQTINQMESVGVKLAVRQTHYLVEAPAGETQYTTRSITHSLDDAAQRGKKSVDLAVRFEFDSDQLSETDMRELQGFGSAMLLRPSYHLVLEGHTDSTGATDYNCGLSMRRAAAARAYLMDRYGVSPTRLEFVGKGADGARDTNATKEGRGKNRRVEFIFSKSNAQVRPESTVGSCPAPTAASAASPPSHG
jgi:outer membrane protein OmpA-like peptidoglycan-associated protein